MKAVLAILFLLPTFVRAETPGCREIQIFHELALLGGERSASDPLAKAYQALCEAKPAPGSELRYPNGQLLAARVGDPDLPLFYENGQEITARAGDDWTTWFYANGQVISFATLQFGARWFYPNGNMATPAAMLPEVAWFHPDGQILTKQTGSKNAWYYPNGQVISESFGQEGAIWYKANGSILYEKGPTLSYGDLCNPAAIFVKYFLSH